MTTSTYHLIWALYQSTSPRQWSNWSHRQHDNVDERQWSMEACGAMEPLRCESCCRGWSTCAGPSAALNADLWMLKWSKLQNQSKSLVWLVWHLENLRIESLRWCTLMIIDAWNIPFTDSCDSSCRDNAEQSESSLGRDFADMSRIGRLPTRIGTYQRYLDLYPAVFWHSLHPFRHSTFLHIIAGFFGRCLDCKTWV